MAAACGTARLVKRQLGKRGGTAPLSEIDYRAVAFGALLPDLIDKPMVWFILRDGKYGGHYVGHSLLFVLPMLVIGRAAAALGESRLQLVAFGAFTHLLYDSMTHVPWSIFYPLTKVNVPNNDILVTTTNLAGELAAIIALVGVLRQPDAWKRISAFVREGVIPG